METKVKGNGAANHRPTNKNRNGREQAAAQEVR